MSNWQHNPKRIGQTQIGHIIPLSCVEGTHRAHSWMVGSWSSIPETIRRRCAYPFPTPVAKQFCGKSAWDSAGIRVLTRVISLFFPEMTHIISPLYYSRIRGRCPLCGSVYYSNKGYPLQRGGIVFRGCKAHDVWCGYMDANTRALPFIAIPSEKSIFTARTIDAQQAENIITCLDFFWAALSHIVPRDNISNSLVNAGYELFTVVGHPNFAHHTFDEICSLYRVCHNRISKSLSIFAYRQPLLPLSGLLNREVVNVPEFDEHLYTDILREVDVRRASPCLLNRRPLTQDLREKIMTVTRREIEPQLVQRIEAFRGQQAKTLWVSVKADNRRCLNLDHVVSKVVEYLQGLGVKWRVVFDGVSFPYDWHPGLGGRIFQEEILRATDEAIERCMSVAPQGVDTININRQPITYTLSMAALSDVYLCHYGTQQHKVFIASQARGVVHGNRSMVKHRSRRLRYLRALGDFYATIVPPTVVELVNSRGSGRDSVRGSIDLYDYTLVPETIATMVLELARRYAR